MARAARGAAELLSGRLRGHLVDRRRREHLVQGIEPRQPILMKPTASSFFLSAQNPEAS